MVGQSTMLPVVQASTESLLRLQQNRVSDRGEETDLPTLVEDMDRLTAAAEQGRLSVEQQGEVHETFDHLHPITLGIFIEHFGVERLAHVVPYLNAAELRQLAEAIAGLEDGQMRQEAFAMAVANMSLWELGQFAAALHDSDKLTELVQAVIDGGDPRQVSYLLSGLGLAGGSEHVDKAIGQLIQHMQATDPAGLQRLLSTWPPEQVGRLLQGLGRSDLELEVKHQLTTAILGKLGATRTSQILNATKDPALAAYVLLTFQTDSAILSGIVEGLEPALLETAMICMANSDGLSHNPEAYDVALDDAATLETFLWWVANDAVDATAKAKVFNAGMSLLQRAHPTEIPAVVDAVLGGLNAMLISPDMPAIVRQLRLDDPHGNALEHFVAAMIVDRREQALANIFTKLVGPLDLAGLDPANCEDIAIAEDLGYFMGALESGAAIVLADRQGSEQSAESALGLIAKVALGIAPLPIWIAISLDIVGDWAIAAGIDPLVPGAQEPEVGNRDVQDDIAAAESLKGSNIGRAIVASNEAVTDPEGTLIMPADPDAWPPPNPYLD